MRPISTVSDELRSAMAVLARQPLHEVLQQQGILQSMARDLVLRHLRLEANLSKEERTVMVAQVWAGLPGEPPATRDDDWIEALPAALPEQWRDLVQRRWEHLCLQKALDQRYGERLEAHFLERREDLEQVVFRLIRLSRQGLAEEVYLRLVDDQASFGDLADRYSLGEEKAIRGFVGPIEIGQLHPTLRSAIRSLVEGAVHPPFLLDQSILVLRLEQRRPASLNEATRHRLLEELLQPDLQAGIDAAVAALAEPAAAGAALAPAAPVLAGR